MQFNYTVLVVFLLQEPLLVRYLNFIQYGSPESAKLWHADHVWLPYFSGTVKCNADEGD